ncbi:ArdC family protein [Roseobacter litoralis]|uniref:ArdC family protein n=1 Tax=Roseobacter litoralis TaxID=42443 RepID=UPI0024904665|nr:zincin-like metallopeptidase domain-containing protein [Roseobacter litoralis]
MAKLDIHQHVTDTIIAQIEAGTPPWRTPWTGGEGGAAFPLRHNGEAYRGINILMLWATAHERGYNSAHWMTFKQAMELGGMVKKGEKCARSVFYGTFEKAADQTEGKSEDDGKTRIPYAKTNNVFNADQIENLPAEFYITPEQPRDLGTEANAELDAFFTDTGADIISSDEARAYYRPATDKIHMPPIRTFHSVTGYYSTLSHELCHWTGASNRLDRIKKFQNREAYAFEELVAEIGNCLLCLHLGVTPQFDQSAAYIESWLKALKDDKGLIFKAASEAQRAVDFILAATDATEHGEAA